MNMSIKSFILSTLVIFQAVLVGFGTHYVIALIIGKLDCALCRIIPTAAGIFSLWLIGEIYKESISYKRKIKTEDSNEEPST